MNKKFLKHYMETNPEGTAQTYIFLVDNQDIALNIVMSGYQALCLVQEDDGYYFSADSFIEEMRAIQFTGSCQSAYHYVTACTVKWMNDKLQTFFKDAGLDGKAGWQLFKEKEYLGKLDNQKEVEKLLEQYILRFERDPKEEPELSRFHLFDAKGNVKGVRDMEIVDYLVENVQFFVVGITPYYYEHGVFLEDHDGVRMKYRIQKLIYRDQVQSGVIKRIYNLLITQPKVHREAYELNKQPVRWINFKNGYYDPVTGEMLEHNPDYLTINQIPFPYYPEDCEQVFEFGKQFAETWFSGFQTLVAVHKDKEHIHCHLVTNSVSYEDGRKLHNTKKDLERMKQLTNQMCRERGMTVAEKGKHFDGSQIEKGEVIAWSKDKYNLFSQQVKDSFVADCAMAVLKALENCISKEKFIEKMKQFGWNVNWTEKRKHITFQNQDGKKVRDSNLSKTFHLDISKEGLENEFNGNREKSRVAADRDSRANEELRNYYRELDAAITDTRGIPDQAQSGEGYSRTKFRKSERVHANTEKADTDTGRRETGNLIRQAEIARRNSEINCRNSASDNRTVRNAEAESVASAEQRRSEEQKRLAEQERARAARRRNKRRSGPEL